VNQANDVMLGVPERAQELDAVYIVVAVDRDGNEGICGHYAPDLGAMMPHVFQKLATVDRVRPIIARIKAGSAPGTWIVLRKFSDAIDLETF
jgi:hypothetical protein